MLRLAYLRIFSGRWARVAHTGAALCSDDAVCQGPWFRCTCFNMYVGVYRGNVYMCMDIGGCIQISILVHMYVIMCLWVFPCTWVHGDDGVETSREEDG